MCAAVPAAMLRSSVSTLTVSVPTRLRSPPTATEAVSAASILSSAVVSATSGETTLTASALTSISSLTVKVSPPPTATSLSPATVAASSRAESVSCSATAKTASPCVVTSMRDVSECTAPPSSRRWSLVKLRCSHNSESGPAIVIWW